MCSSETSILIFFLRQGLFLNLELSSLARLVGQWIRVGHSGSQWVTVGHRISVSTSQAHLDFFLIWILGDLTQVLMCVWRKL